MQQKLQAISPSGIPLQARSFLPRSNIPASDHPYWAADRQRAGNRSRLFTHGKSAQSNAAWLPGVRSSRDELFESDMAQLGASPVVDSARVPFLQFAQIQASRVAVIRWFAQHVCTAPGALHVLLAPVLLVFVARRKRYLASRKWRWACPCSSGYRQLCAY
jgi:hypothetical protein